MDWKKLISGKVTELKDAIANFPSQTICAMATVRTGEDGKEYQGVYSYEFLPSFALGCFTGEVKKNYKSVDKFIGKVTDIEYGCKDFYVLKPLVEYDPTKNVINTTNKPVVQNTKVTTSERVANTQAAAVDDLPF